MDWMECVNQGKLDGNIKCQYIYLNADDIPELIMKTNDYEGKLLIYHDGKAVLIDFSLPYNGRYLLYIPKTGVIYEHAGGTGADSIAISQLVGTEVLCVGEGFWQSWKDWDNGEIEYIDFLWNGEEVTQEEYGAYMKELLSDQPSEIIWEYKWIGATDLQYELGVLNPER